MPRYISLLYDRMGGESPPHAFFLRRLLSLFPPPPYALITGYQLRSNRVLSCLMAYVRAASPRPLSLFFCGRGDVSSIRSRFGRPTIVPIAPCQCSGHRPCSTAFLPVVLASFQGLSLSRLFAFPFYYQRRVGDKVPMPRSPDMRAYSAAGASLHSIESRRNAPHYLYRHHARRFYLCSPSSMIEDFHAVFPFLADDAGDIASAYIYTHRVISRIFQRPPSFSPFVDDALADDTYRARLSTAANLCRLSILSLNAGATTLTMMLH